MSAVESFQPRFQEGPRLKGASMIEKKLCAKVDEDKTWRHMFSLDGQCYER